MYRVSISGVYAYVASYTELFVVDVSEPKNPRSAGDIETEGSVRDVVVNGGYAYIADMENGLLILDIHLPPQAALHVTADHTSITSLSIRNGSLVGVLVEADNVDIEDCAITGNYDGMKVVNASEGVGIHGSDIHDNVRYGVSASKNNETIVSTEDNWWGDPFGPYHPILNPEGKGNAASDNVDFDPWLPLPKDYKIHHVSPDGNDTTGTGDEGNPYKSIQKAIDMAQDWDTIIVESGTYSESITIDKRNVTIVGEGPETTFLDGGGNEGTATTCTITADNVELDGFTIRNGNENGILITNSSSNRIVNCVFPDNSYDLNLTNSMDNELINTTFDSVFFSDPSSSIFVLWPVDLKVTNNRSGFIPGAHVMITDNSSAVVFDDHTDEKGRISQLLLLDYVETSTSRIDHNPYTISIKRDGYLDFEGEHTVNSYTRASFMLQEHILPVAAISGDLVRHVDMDNEITFDGSNSTGRYLTYRWDFGDGKGSTSPTPSHIYTVPGAYQVNLTVRDDYNNASTTSIVVIVTNVLPIARADANISYIFEDESIEFTAQDSWDTLSDSLTYLWDFDDGTWSYEMTVSHTFTEAGEYAVTLTVTDQYGGESSTVLPITVTNLVPWDVSAGEDKFAHTNHEAVFHGSAKDTISDYPTLHYLWDFGDGTMGAGQNVTHTYSEPGVYAVNLTVTDNNGALAHTLIYAMITDPFIMVNISSSDIFQDETVFFNASHELDDGSFVYTWYFGDGTTAVVMCQNH